VIRAAGREPVERDTLYNVIPPRADDNVPIADGARAAAAHAR
jgi:hypothetical protein